MASEQMTNNPIHYQNVCALAKRCPVTLVDHATILNDMANDVDYFIRTGGAFEPGGAMLLLHQVLMQLNGLIKRLLLCQRVTRIELIIRINQRTEEA